MHSQSQTQLFDSRFFRAYSRQTRRPEIKTGGYTRSGTALPLANGVRLSNHISDVVNEYMPETQFPSGVPRANNKPYAFRDPKSFGSAKQPHPRIAPPFLTVPPEEIE